MSGLNETRLVDGVVVIESEHHLSADQRERVVAQLKAAWPGRNVVLLDGGLRVSNAAQLDRIESMLARLLDALAEDDQDDAPAVDLEGAPLPRERSLDEPL